VNRRCLQLNRSWTNPEWQALHFVRQRHFVACFVGKAGSISWARIMLQLTGNKKAAMLANLTRGQILSRFRYGYVGWMTRINASSRLAYLLDSYKTMVVRDPLTRLISAYRHIILILGKEVPQIKHICRPNVSHRLIRICLFPVQYNIHSIHDSCNQWINWNVSFLSSA